MKLTIFIITLLSVQFSFALSSSQCVSKYKEQQAITQEVIDNYNAAVRNPKNYKVNRSTYQEIIITEQTENEYDLLLEACKKHLIDAALEAMKKNNKKFKEIARASLCQLDFEPAQNNVIYISQNIEKIEKMIKGRTSLEPHKLMAFFTFSAKLKETLEQYKTLEAKGSYHPCHEFEELDSVDNNIKYLRSKMSSFKQQKNKFMQNR